VSVSLAVMNLILAVIVDSAEQARKQVDAENVAQRHKRLDEATVQFLEKCKEYDADANGSISKDEMSCGLLETMTEGRLYSDDADAIFDALADNDGLDYNRLADFMVRMRSLDNHSMFLELMKLQHKLHRQALAGLEEAKLICDALKQETELGNTAMADPEESRCPSSISVEERVDKVCLSSVEVKAVRLCGDDSLRDIEQPTPLSMVQKAVSAHAAPHQNGLHSVAPAHDREDIGLSI